jgi:hypothetical protein
VSGINLALALGCPSSFCGADKRHRAYEFFINPLRHPYALCPMLAVSMITPPEKDQGFYPRRIGDSGMMTTIPVFSALQVDGRAVKSLAAARCYASRGGAKKLLRVGSRIAGQLASDWYAVYVETPREEPGGRSIYHLSFEIY